MTTIINPAC